MSYTKSSLDAKNMKRPEKLWDLATASLSHMKWAHRERQRGPFISCFLVHHPWIPPLHPAALYNSRVPHRSFPPLSAAPSLLCLATETGGVEGSCPCAVCAYERHREGIY